MQSEKLQRAIGTIHVRFGDHALMRAGRLPPVLPWPTGQPAVDHLSGIGGLPRGRISVLQGAMGSGKLSLALALLARGTREFARTVALDPARSLGPWALDPWMLDQLSADLDTLTLIRPPTPAVVGEAAVSLARAGAGLLVVLGTPPEPALGPLESAAARSGCLVVVVSEPADDRTLAFASSLTLELEWLGWIRERGQEIGMWSRLRCVKNKLAAPGAGVDLEIRYALCPRQVPGEPLRMVEPPDVIGRNDGAPSAEPEHAEGVERGERVGAAGWQGRSAAG